ncbi:hypothetical protein ANN_08290 [Periplaneta americana]|uniref:Uncharacterized protein n=1 Tax=Periplaneta americana TaxID=6978 RepID=A0ABQ8T2I8_PERAM|nr:hypothetical protein ANN_08290 [Periplaneta americana]
MARSCEGDNEPAGSLKAICKKDGRQAEEEMGRTRDATQREPVDTHPYDMGPKDWQTERWKTEDKMGRRT